MVSGKWILIFIFFNNIIINSTKLNYNMNYIVNETGKGKVIAWIIIT